LSLVTRVLEHDVTEENVISFRDCPDYLQKIVTGAYFQEVGVNVTPDPMLNYASRLYCVWGSRGLDSQISNLDTKIRLDQL
jgi:hypothetical protein